MEALNQAIDHKIITQYQIQRPKGIRRHLCHAPFQNIYWGRNGKASSCCYNRQFILGQYPRQSVSDIWFGKKLQELRSQFSPQTLGRGCQLCTEQLHAGNFTGLRAATYDKFAGRPSTQLKAKWTTNKSRAFSKTIELLSSSGGRKKIQTWLSRWWSDQQGPSTELQKEASISYPRSMEFELSNTCNLECSMCFGDYSSSIRKNREKLPPLPEYYDEHFVEQLKEFIPHLWEAKFYGGEPFLIPIYYQIWELFIEDNPSALISITTNGTIFNQKVVRILDKLNVFIVLSIDSLVKTTYEQIRKNAKFDRVQSHISEFQALALEKGHRLSFSVCPMTINQHEIPDLVQYCCDQGIYIYFNTVWFPLHLSLRSLSRDALEKLIATYEAFSIVGSDSISQQNINVFQGLIQQLKKWLLSAQDLPNTPQENFIL